MRFGATIDEGGVRFRVWAPDARDVRLLLRRGGVVDARRPTRDQSGIWTLFAEDMRAGDRYAYTLDGSPPLPDPASRAQPDGVHGWSAVVDPSAFAWSDGDWHGVDARDVVIYELHVGTFTPEGTFAAAAARLPDLRDLGVTAIELMPVADFPGARNWGYDGVCLFAPSRAYGSPDDFRAFVNAAHREGLAVLLDVVYNHLGPEGAYLTVFAPSFFTEQHRTPWGAGTNLDMRGSDVVRAFIIGNALHWIREYHLDGLRLDATHALVDHSAVPFVAELTAHVHGARAARPLVYAEDSRNLCTMVEPAAVGGWDLDGVWADDFHHVVRCMLAGDHEGYFEDFAGTSAELAATLHQGWLFTGQRSRHLGGPRGTDPARVPLRTAVICLQNHDQIGNRALGERLHHQVSAAAWRSAVAVLLTAPMTPLLFMGQEWAASTPFLFFSDFEPALADAVRDGRRREFSAFPAFATPEGAAKIPDPQAVGTFERSRLRWAERGDAEHAGILSLHRDLLRLRRARAVLRASDELTGAAHAPDAGSVAFSRGDGPDRLLVVARLAGDGPVRVEDGGNWRTLLSTEDARYGGRPERASFDGAAGIARFQGPGALILERAAHDRAA